MAIDIKVGASNWGRVEQPYVKLSASQWTPLKRALAKTTAGWKEVWPSEIVYIHTGVGYNLNMHACFGYPSGPANYIFINNGTIGGSHEEFALRTGVFPAGSNVTFINNGLVSGKGGNAGGFTGSMAGYNCPQAGGDGMLLEYNITIDNTNGVIQGGGGGGGGGAEISGTQHFAPGGGGAGVPVGLANQYITTARGYSANNGTYTTGGYAYKGGRGGNPGETGGTAVSLGNSGSRKMGAGAPGGVAILNSGYIVSAIALNDGVNVKGRRIGGRGVYGYAKLLSMDINFPSSGGTANAYFKLYGPVTSVSFARIGGAVLTDYWAGKTTLQKISNTHCRIPMAGSRDRNADWTGTYMYNTTIRAAANSPAGTVNTDFSMAWAAWWAEYQPPSCFTGDSLVTMADGSLRRIDTILPGDLIKTPFGCSTVDWIRTPQLGGRPLYAFSGGRCKTSGEHGIWTKTAEGREWWGTRDIGQWQIEADNHTGPGLNGEPAIDLCANNQTHAVVATEDGWQDLQWSVVEDAPSDTQLYHLYLKDHASYFVDGVLVIGELPRYESLIDWKQFEWNPAAPVQPVYMEYAHELTPVDKNDFPHLIVNEETFP